MVHRPPGMYSIQQPYFSLILMGNDFVQILNLGSLSIPVPMFKNHLFKYKYFIEFSCNSSGDVVSRGSDTYKQLNYSQLVIY